VSADLRIEASRVPDAELGFLGRVFRSLMNSAG
jgi:hypothetical protein